jgi:hypothetical protein
MMNEKLDVLSRMMLTLITKKITFDLSLLLLRVALYMILQHT